MSKGFVSWVTLGAFLFYSWACTLYRVSTTPPEKRPARNAGIIAVNLKSGDVITFGPNNPARIQGNAVVGQIVQKNLSLKKADIQSRIEGEKGELTFIMKNGKKYAVQEIYAEDLGTVIVRTTPSHAIPRFVLEESAPALMKISIPLAEVESLKVRRVDIGLSAMASLVAIMGSLALVGGYVWAHAMSSMWD